MLILFFIFIVINTKVCSALFDGLYLKLHGNNTIITFNIRYITGPVLMWQSALKVALPHSNHNGLITAFLKFR